MKKYWCCSDIFPGVILVSSCVSLSLGFGLRFGLAFTNQSYDIEKSWFFHFFLHMMQFALCCPGFCLCVSFCVKVTSPQAVTKRNYVIQAGLHVLILMPQSPKRCPYIVFSQYCRSRTLSVLGYCSTNKAIPQGPLQTIFKIYKLL